MSRGINAAKRLAWQERLQRFVSNGRVSVAEFCRQEQVSIASFYAWRKKLGPGDEAGSARGAQGVKAAVVKPARGSGFVPVHVTASAPPVDALEIRLPNGARLRCPSHLGAADWLPSLVAAAGLAVPALGRQRSLAEERPC
jgi:hypothetical protein